MQDYNNKPAAPVLPETWETSPAYKISSRFHILRYFSFANIRNLIYIIFALSLAYLIVALVYPRFGFKKINSAPLQQEMAPDLEPAAKFQTKPFASYLSDIKSRQLFGNWAVTETPAQTEAVIDTNINLTEDLHLIGIIPGKNYQAVIEDKKLQKIFYAAKGQFIGVFQVEDIQDNKVILDSQGRKYELYF